MRRALGLMPGGRATAARRQETVAVEHRGGRSPGQGVNRVAVAESALAEERKRREQAERERDEAKAALHEAQTKFGHAELARDEEIAARKEAIAARDEALAALEAERRARADAAGQVNGLAVGPDVANGGIQPVARRRGRPPKLVVAPTQDEGEPVQWWIPGWTG